MNRITFIKTLSLLPLSGGLMNLFEFGAMSESFENTMVMPTFFFGHGSPMNAIEENEFTRGWQDCIKNVPKPRAILCISAHWETRGVFVTAMDKPETIHDFGGFPKALFDVQYPAAGDLEVAKLTKEVVASEEVQLDQHWGLDHGCWSVVKNLYPKADVPVLQFSLNVNQTPQWHYELAKQLNVLRNKGILIVGSGNIVHNLGMLNWQQTNGGFDWANEANTKVKQLIENNEFDRLTQYQNMGRALQLAVPTPEHFLPLLYIMALKGKDEPLRFFNDKLVMGSISMTSLQIG